MTNQHTEQFFTTLPGPFEVRKIHAGVDYAFTIDCQSTNRWTMVNQFWDERLVCEVGAETVAEALAALKQQMNGTKTRGRSLPADLFFARHNGPFQFVSVVDEFANGEVVDERANEEVVDERAIGEVVDERANGEVVDERANGETFAEVHCVSSGEIVLHDPAGSVNAEIACRTITDALNLLRDVAS